MHTDANATAKDKVDAWQISEWGELERVERELLTPGPDQIRLRMIAQSINYRDLLMLDGKYNPRQPLPLIPLSDGVGEIEMLGANVEAEGKLSVGDRVTPLFCPKWQGGRPTRSRLRKTLGGPLDGTLRSHMVIDAASVVPVPEHLGDAAAATLPCTGVTAWSALVTHAEVTPGDWVLIQGTGGVSIFALQFAKMLGLRTIITSSKDEKLERAGILGAEHTINYADDADWGRTARSITGGRGVDLVIEVGGADTLEQSLKAVAIGGQLSMIGVLGGTRAPSMDLIPVVMQQVRLQGILVGSRDGHEAMCRAVATHELEPVVDTVFSFDEAPAAFGYLRSGAHFGKVVIAAEA